ncbi:hypothetical protein BOX15_Mlig012667g1 [Macrostomum lignano]|uniref:EF-hand domain-containing protein n=1 Tax=Macrostomum lignano TaxID=282301 RepID=A0A267DGP8_9PLAT|nr:hypothetical protein BOX15_Mlig012667g1 [Macrostomum lignano]
MGNDNSKQFMSGFQNKKVTHEFRTFFDFNKDGSLTEKDFVEAKEKICKMSGWKAGLPQYGHMETLFSEVWQNLHKSANEDGDEEISEEEWCAMWDSLFEKMARDKELAEKEKREYQLELPDWLSRYFEYKFNLLDRTRDNEVDIEEYEYVMQDFGVKPKDARDAFKRFTEGSSKKLDKAYFLQLCRQYFISDDPEDPGNFINGKLEWDDLEVKYCPRVEESKLC